jgi:hypothetical protein
MKVFYILSFILLTAVQSKSQTGNGPFHEPTIKIAKFYPNPAVSQINFEFEGNTNSYSFQIYSFVGKKMVDLNSIPAKTTVNVTDFYRGVYIYQLKDKNGKIIDSGKFQVSH